MHLNHCSVTELSLHSNSETFACQTLGFAALEEPSTLYKSDLSSHTLWATEELQTELSVTKCATDY